MSYPHSLSSLTPREAITDALYRAIIGFDRHNVPIFNSAMTEDAIMELNAGNYMKVQGLSNIREQLLDFVGPMDTTHTASNVRIDVKDGADTAHLTAYFLAQHCPPGKGGDVDAPKYLVGGEYLVDLVRDDGDGLWKIREWRIDAIWKEGDASIIQRPS